ncbi:hypothetical protein [Nodularia sphaerocarpa]|uniref:hypothetical protein n=1 Tax=Nodularia sphaerocarpa TaxID=137816 RepID=UPI001EFB1700|nr:hypothetical protein [Nodularia sphaerocarpa]MDB9372933.1 hypothetical protein [Nodularia sphaerocarpa CS-585]MDB9377417.1 hypothetical protein [Nodularia sphaerocarpa CS-585A2]ULP71672.1 hypothetical protein BDGGKGIB_01304 [Nodularia sphaerocarpa UHCC 0038]
MQIEKRLENHYKRWNIEFSYEEEFFKFKNRLVSIIDKLIGNYLVLNSDVDKSFFETFKLHKADEPYVKKAQLIPKLSATTIKDLQGTFRDFEYTHSGFGDTNVYRCVNDCKTPQELATVLQFVFWALEVKHNVTQDFISEIVKEIRRISLLTPSASFQISRKGKQVIIYPHGDQFLDIGIIDCVLSGLEDYPKVAEHFENALKIYQRGEISQYRNLLDNLRFALEQFLKQIFTNDIRLEKQKEALEKWFKQKGLHPQVLNLYKELLFNQYARYQNDAVKHNEQYSVDEVEFMIYLTGNFIRLILQLARQVNNVTEL